MILGPPPPNRRVKSNGCSSWAALGERYAEELRAELPEVDEFFGVKEGRHRSGAGGDSPASACDRTPAHHPETLRLPENFEGCNWKCGFAPFP